VLKVQASHISSKTPVVMKELGDRGSLGEDENREEKKGLSNSAERGNLRDKCPRESRTKMGTEFS